MEILGDAGTFLLHLLLLAKGFQTPPQALVGSAPHADYNRDRRRPRLR